MNETFKSISLFIIIFFFLSSSLFPQSDYLKNPDVIFNVSSSIKDYIISYSFKDQWDKIRQVTLTYPKIETDSMIAKFGISKKMLEPYVMDKDTIKLRENIFKNGFFKLDKNTICVDKCALLDYYAPVFCKPIAKAIQSILEKDSADTRIQRIEMALKFIQDIPYGIPQEDQQNKFKGGMLTPPEILLNMYGDCDSKTILFVGIAIYLIDPKEVFFIKDKDHLLAAIQGEPITGQSFIKLNRMSLILAEPTGPARLFFGSTDIKANKELTIEMINLEKNEEEFEIFPSYTINTKIDQMRYSDFVKIKPTIFKGEPYQKAGAEAYHIKVKNIHNQLVNLVIRFCNIKGEWVTKGWYQIETGETAYLEDTQNRYFYIYAESFDKIWDGKYQMNLGVQKFNGFEIHIPSEKFENYTFIFQ